jgi:hypothetical protein
MRDMMLGPMKLPISYLQGVILLGGRIVEIH